MTLSLELQFRRVHLLYWQRNFATFFSLTMASCSFALQPHCFSLYHFVSEFNLREIVVLCKYAWLVVTFVACSIRI